MRIIRFAAFIAFVGVVAGSGCGNGDQSATTTSESVGTTTTPATTASPATISSSSTPTTSASTTTTSPTTSTATITSTTAVPAGEQLRILRPDGIGPVDFGTSADEAMTALSELLGPPDRDDTIYPTGECVEGSGWEDCLRANDLVERGRIVRWTDQGLTAILTDCPGGAWCGEGSGQIAVPLHLAGWRAVGPDSGGALATSEGFEPGMTVGQLRTTYPVIEGFYNEGIVDGVGISTVTGDLIGELDWDRTSTGNDWSELVRAVQRALNAQGAELEADGEWGVHSQQAWELFLRDRGLEAPPTMWLTPEIGQALGMPADDFVVTALTGG